MNRRDIREAVEHFVARFVEENGREPSRGKIAAALGISAVVVRKVLKSDDDMVDVVEFMEARL